MSVRYIGSKARIAEGIVNLAGRPTGGRFIDAFCGTGSVAAEASRRGWAVTVNDALPSAVAMSVGAIVGTENVPFDALGGYLNAIRALQEAEPVTGFIFEEYSPASRGRKAVERKYFTKRNAARLDGMRELVRRWSDAGLLSQEEELLLLSDLMRAANSVANISGTYGCFLKEWTPTALKPVVISPRLLPVGHVDFRTRVGDVFEVPTEDEDTVYYDPPYTKRQYSAYYHILETIYAGDRPKVEGVTGLRPWQSKASIFCYKSKALAALTRLMRDTVASMVLLSYSTEGHVPKDALVEALSSEGDVVLHKISDVGRYRPNSQASAAGHTVEEFLVEFHPTRRPAGILSREAALP